MYEVQKKITYEVIDLKSYHKLGTYPEHKHNEALQEMNLANSVYNKAAEEFERLQRAALKSQPQSGV